MTLRHADLIDQMTLEEKAAILTGASEWETRAIPRLGIPSVFLADGPHGIRKQAGAGDHLGLNPSEPATCFPTAATIANSWDPELAEEVGAALGREARSLGVDVVLGPGLNVKRSPLCGRNFEYLSEDPLLAGQLAAAYVRGIQSQGVAACPKHFAVNSQETHRMSVDEVVDERTLRELYLPGFEACVRAGARVIMTSYNRVNGEFANENRHLLTDVLRGDWGFDGCVVTDWGGSNDHVAAVACRSDLEMPTAGLDSARQVFRAVSQGSLSEERVDACVDDLLELVLSCARSRPEARGERRPDQGLAAHHELARRAAAASVVLLRNEAGPSGARPLPLSPGARVALVGDFARDPRYQGAGSSLVNSVRVETLEGALAGRGVNVVGFARGYVRGAAPDRALEAEAADLAARADVVLLACGLDEASEVEGQDRSTLALPSAQVALVERLTEAGTPVVAVLSGGSVMDLAWEDRCAAVAYGCLGGEAGAAGMADVLTGAVNPSGRLAETYPMTLADTPCAGRYPSRGRVSAHVEGLFVGYRHYVSAGIPVRHPFGFGLSYTRFAYADFAADSEGVSFTLTNVGDKDGAEVAQVYVGAPGTRVFSPRRVLAGFARVFLRAGESRRVHVGLPARTWCYWNVVTGRWEEEPGMWRVEVGASCEDIRLRATVGRPGTEAPAPYAAGALPHYEAGDVTGVTEGEFAVLLGGPVPEGGLTGPVDEHDSVSTLGRARSRLARLACRAVGALVARAERRNQPDLNLLFVYNIPFRAIAKMTGGHVSPEMVGGVVDACNGRLLRGLRRLAAGYVRNARENRDWEHRLDA